MMKVHFKEYELLDGSKKRLVQRVGDGSIIKRFDMTPVPRQPEDVVCPHFLELKWAYGCPYKCAWCYLQGTLRMLPSKTKPRFKEYSKVLKHINVFTFSDTDREILNAGEISDALMGEHLEPPFSAFVAQIFEGSKHRVILLSKSSNVRNLLKLYETNLERPIRCLIPSWSLNAAPVAERWERGAPRVEDRIEAARRVSEVGYEVRIRIDPIVPGYLASYHNLVDDVFSAFTPERITLGSLRGLQSTITTARDRSWVTYLKEPSGWGKRVDFQTRLEMYRGVIDHLRSSHGFHRIALCKETAAMWNKLGLDWTRPLCNCVW